MLTVLCPERRAIFLLIIWWLVFGAHRYRRTLNTCAISLWAANCSLTQLLFNHGYLLNGGNTKNNWHNTCGAQILEIGLSTGSDTIITDTGYCSTWRENERWQVQTNTFPCTTEDHKLFKKIWIHASRHIVTINIDSEEETVNSEWEGVNGSLMSATIMVNFNWTLNLKLTRLLSWGVQSVLSFQH